MQKPIKVFWITNFSDRNVSLADLNMTVPARSSVNLLDSKHYSFTEEQVLQSATSGSIFKKSHLISVRRVPPQMIPRAQIIIDPHSVLPARSASIYEIKRENYEELDFEDDTLIEGPKINTSPTPKE